MTTKEKKPIASFTHLCKCRSSEITPAETELQQPSI